MHTAAMAGGPPRLTRVCSPRSGPVQPAAPRAARRSGGSRLPLGRQRQLPLRGGLPAVPARHPVLRGPGRVEGGDAPVPA